MAESSVSRCVAVAAHGKRCQQTPFRGSPYCWHHTQSRKVWAPSRSRPTPPTTRPADGARRPGEPAPGRPVAAVPAPAPEDNLPAIVALLAQRMDPRDFAELVHFLANVDDGSLQMVKQDGDLVDVRLERRRQPPAQVRRAGGAKCWPRAPRDSSGARSPGVRGRRRSGRAGRG